MRPIVHFIVPQGPQRGARTVYRPVLPRGVLQVARSAERAGWDATVLDGYSVPHLLPAYLQLLADRRKGGRRKEVLPSAVGICLHGPPAIEPALGIAERLREIEPALPLLFGGQLANADPDLLLPLLPERSILFCGDGDFDISTVLQATLEASGEARLIRQAGVHPWHSIPALDLVLPGVADYLAEPDFEYHLETQIGCPYRCFHCGTGRKGLYARTRNRPIEAIQEELDQVVATAGRHALSHPRLWITDETFGSDPMHARAFCEALLSRPETWTWRAQSRADTISEDLLEIMRRAGCRRLAFGVEIPNDAGLDLLGKREAMRAVEQAFAMCNRQGISPEAIFVVGTPGDPTRPEDFVDVLDALGAGSVQSYIYHPIPGSPWWRKYGTRLKDCTGSLDRWSDLDFHSPPLNATPADVERAIVAFLALQAWQPPSRRSGQIGGLPKVWQLACVSCGDTPELEPVYSHRATETEILRYTSGQIRYYVVATPGSVKVLEHDPRHHGNLYSSLFALDSGVLSLALCPRCSFAEESRDLPATPSQDPSFLAI
jgi:hypothetical protein